MARPLQKIKEEIRSLSPVERDSLLRDLIAGLDNNPEESLETVWLGEAHRRYYELKAGSVEGISAESALQKARERLRSAP